MHRRYTLVLAILTLNVLFAAVRLRADEKIPIEFPELEGWHRGTRYDEAPPRGNEIRSTINYTTKAKVGTDYVRADVQVKETKGKELADLAGEQAKKIEQNPILKNVMKVSGGEVTIGGAKVHKLVYTAEKGAFDKSTVELYVIPYGKYYIFFDHTGQTKDAAAHAKEATKLVETLVGAAK